MKIGYIRVSTQEQNTIRQETLMEALGVDEIYMDKVSGKNTNRPELQKMLHYLRMQALTNRKSAQLYIIALSVFKCKQESL